MTEEPINITKREHYLMVITITASVVAVQVADGIRESLLESFQPTVWWTQSITWLFYAVILAIIVAVIVGGFMKLFNVKPEE